MHQHIRVILALTLSLALAGIVGAVRPQAALASSVLYVRTTQDVSCGDPAGMSLRCALYEATQDYLNGTPGDTINFSQLSTSDPNYISGAWFIEPTSELPQIRGGSIVIDGWTAPGASQQNGTRTVVISGYPGTRSSSWSGNQDGLEVYGAVTARGLAVVDWPDTGIYVQGSGAIISGDEVGGDTTGIRIDRASSLNTVGGTGAGDANYIGGATTGVLITGASNNTVEGNFIGGTAQDPNNYPNTYGVRITGSLDPNTSALVPATGNTIGGAAKNVITGSVQGSTFGGARVGGYGVYVDNKCTIADTCDNSGNKIQNDYIGVNSTGTQAEDNDGAGVYVYGDSNTLIGGYASSSRNVISGNGVVCQSGSTSCTPTTADGIDLVDTTGTSVVGNYMGLTADGSSALPNTGDGIHLGGVDPNNHPVGNTNVTIAANVIGGNGNDGIDVCCDGASAGTTIQSNLIGTGAGLNAVPNSGDGIYIHDQAQGTVSGDVVGGYDTGDNPVGNVIANNGGAGVAVGSSSTDGTTVDISINSIYANTGSGIILNGQPVNSCANALTAGAPNGYTPCPDSIVPWTTRVYGTACPSCTVELFIADEPIPGNFGQGRTFLNSTTAGSNGSWSISLSPGQLLPDECVTATATLTASSGAVETSGFSQNACVSGWSTAISRGWNQIDVPMAATGITSTSALAGDMDASDQLGAKAVAAVATHANGRFALFVPDYSSDVSLLPSSGIFVLSKTAGTWTPAGSLYSSAQSVSLVKGWNLVAAVYPTAGLTPTQISCQIHAAGGSVAELAWYDPSMAGYDTWLPRGGGGGTLSYVSPTDGLWIDVTTPPTSGSWTPGSPSTC